VKPDGYIKVAAPDREKLSDPNHKVHRLRLSMGRYSVPVPRSKALRIGLGVGLCLGGVFWFLPVLGLWMLPLGLLVLSIDFPPVRRMRRRTAVHWGRRRARQQKKGRAGGESGPQGIG
jgi:hypothetical protein